jgi:hypothetical protein
MRRIRKPEMCEGVRHQKVTELVVNAWNGNPQTRKKREPQTDRHQKKQETAEKATSRDGLDASPYGTRDSLT